MGAAREAEERSAGPASRQSARGAAPAAVAPAAARVLALQRTAGNRAVTRQLAREAAVVTPAKPERKVARGFWGSVWGGIKAVGGGIKAGAEAVGGAVKTGAVAVKNAAVAVGGAVAGAAGWVWDGAKAAGQWAVDWLKTASSAVVDAITWFGKGAWDIIKVVGTVLWEKLSLLGSLCWDLIRLFPFRVWNLIVDGWRVIPGLIGWLRQGLKEGLSWSWVWDGLKTAFLWLMDTAVNIIEVLGIAEALQFVWGMAFHTRELTKEEREASEMVHGKGLIPYWQVRVDEGSYIVKLGKWINKIFGNPNASERAVTTMHVIQAPSGVDVETVVHELTHVAQYNKIGAVYMVEALHAQAIAKADEDGGYDYTKPLSLADAAAAGKKYKDYNREQQAQMAEDYYLLSKGRPPRETGGTLAGLQPMIDQLRANEL